MKVKIGKHFLFCLSKLDAEQFSGMRIWFFSSFKSSQCARFSQKETTRDMGVEATAKTAFAVVWEYTEKVNGSASDNETTGITLLLHLLFPIKETINHLYIGVRPTRKNLPHNFSLSDARKTSILCGGTWNLQLAWLIFYLNNNELDDPRDLLLLSKQIHQPTP